MRAYHGTHPYEKALRKRRVWVEPLFAEAKDWHGMRRFRLRRLEKVNMEALLIASGQNVKRLLAFGSRGPRKRAQAAALGPSAAAGREIHCAREHRARRRSVAKEDIFQQADAFVLSGSLIDPSYMVPCVPEHAEIWGSLKARDRDRAVDLIEHHLSNAHERLRQVPLEK